MKSKLTPFVLWLWIAVFMAAYLHQFKPMLPRILGAFDL